MSASNILSKILQSDLYFDQRYFLLRREYFYSGIAFGCFTDSATSKNSPAISNCHQYASNLTKAKYLLACNCHPLRPLQLEYCLVEPRSQTRNYPRWKSSSDVHIQLFIASVHSDCAALFLCDDQVLDGAIVTRWRVPNPHRNAETSFNSGCTRVCAGHAGRSQGLRDGGRGAGGLRIKWTHSK